METFLSTLESYSLLTAMALVGLIMFVGYALSKTLTSGRVHGSAVAIFIGLVIAYFAGVATGGKDGIADITIFAGMGLLGGSMLRDFAIVSTAFGADVGALKRAGWAGVASILIGVIVSFAAGAAIALAFGYTDAVSITTIGAGAVTYIVGPVTGTAINASSDVIALSIGAGLIKSIAVMIATPLLAKKFGLTNPESAMVYGGLMGTTSGVAAGLAATDMKLVPYGSMTATFYTGVGCLLCPSILFYFTQILAS
jgi:malonate transporter MadM subunit